MTRMAVAGCMALAALGAVAVLDVGSATAEAAPSVSPFAGTYVAPGWPVPITISDGGQITSSYSGAGREKGSISGRVSAAGSYSYTVSRTFFNSDAVHGHLRGEWQTVRSTSAGTMEPDPDGNIVVTTDGGASAVWLRR